MEGQQQPHASQTICLVGFPPEGVLPRELKNICRFMTGFEGAHVAFGGVGLPSTLFVKFSSAELAAAAMDTLHGQPFDLDSPQLTLKAEYARREMEVRPYSPMPAPVVAPASRPHQSQFHHAVPQPSFHHAVPHGNAMVPAPGGKRTGTTGGELVTIVVFALREKGLSVDDLQAWFQTRPGFVSMQINDRIDGMFIRFDTATMADRALHDANAQNVGAEWARRNLDDDRGAPAPMMPMGAAPYHQPSMLQQHLGGPPRRVGATGGELVTICVLGVAMKEVSADQMQDWFQSLPGFDRQQMNDRIGGLFVKFTSAQDAEYAIQQANQNGYGAEWARRNLDDDTSSRQTSYGGPPMPMQHMAPGGYGKGGGGGMPGMPPPKRARPASGEIDTIMFLGATLKQQQVGDLQQWFANRPGYVALSINDRIDAMFVKFSHRSDAEQGMADANATMNLSAEWARRNLDL